MNRLALTLLLGVAYSGSNAFAQSPNPSASTNPSTAKMGIDHTVDPEIVSVQDAAKVWAQMGSVDKTTHAFTPVGGATSAGGDVNIAKWGGQVVGPLTSLGVSPGPGLFQNTNAFILNLPPGAATSANQPVINGDGGAQVHVMNPSAATGWTPDYSYSTPLAVTSTSNFMALPPAATVGSTIKVYNRGLGSFYWAPAVSSATLATSAMPQLSPNAWDSFVVTSGITGIVAVTSNSQVTASMAAESGKGSPNGTGGPINTSLFNTTGAIGVAYTNIGAMDSSHHTTEVVSTPPGAASTTYMLAVQGSPSGVPIPVTGTFTSTVGGFTPNSVGRMVPLNVGTSDVSGTLPTGSTVVVSNVGATNPMYCNVNGLPATNADQPITPNGGWFAFTIPPGITLLHCISPAGVTIANGIGGAGIATGTGGGSGGSGGGGSGGAITAPLGPSTLPSAAVATADTGTPITGQSLSAGGQGLTGWISQLVAGVSQGVFATATPATPPSQAILIGQNDINGKSVPSYIEPCRQTKSYFDLSTATGTGVQLVAGSAGKKIYVCGGTFMMTSAAAHVSLVEGTGSTCTSPASVLGNNTASVSAAAGLPFAANGGIAPPGVTIAATASPASGNSLCVLFDTANTPTVNVHVAYVQE